MTDVGSDRSDESVDLDPNKNQVDISSFSSSTEASLRARILELEKRELQLVEAAGAFSSNLKGNDEKTQELFDIRLADLQNQLDAKSEQISRLEVSAQSYRSQAEEVQVLELRQLEWIDSEKFNYFPLRQLRSTEENQFLQTRLDEAKYQIIQLETKVCFSGLSCSEILSPSFRSTFYSQTWTRPNLPKRCET